MCFCTMILFCGKENGMIMSKWCQIFHSWINYSFNIFYKLFKESLIYFQQSFGFGERLCGMIEVNPTGLLGNLHIDTIMQLLFLFITISIICQFKPLSCMLVTFYRALDLFAKLKPGSLLYHNDTAMIIEDQTSSKLRQLLFLKV